jgi:hypothetical protein
MPTAHKFPWSDAELASHMQKAVLNYWIVRSGQAKKQATAGRITDAGTRSEVTGGKHLDGFRDLICDLIRQAGFSETELRFKSRIELPGYYRPTKRWDVVVIRKNRLCAAIELKSQNGSFGNNVQSRTEEAIGNSVDIWRAFKEKLIGPFPPWVGYFFLLGDNPGSTRPVRLPVSEFEPDRIFTNTSYADRYRILCERMVLERNYNSAALILSPPGERGKYSEPAKELGVAPFLKSLFGHLIGCT